jgi:hypothetical protein
VDPIAKHKTIYKGWFFTTKMGSNLEEGLLELGIVSTFEGGATLLSSVVTTGWEKKTNPLNLPSSHRYFHFLGPSDSISSLFWATFRAASRTYPLGP